MKELPELLSEWSALKLKRSGKPPQVHVQKELHVLELLQKAGCANVPDEPLTVEFMISDRKRALREMQQRLH
jgi:hypothetical protein